MAEEKNAATPKAVDELSFKHEKKTSPERTAGFCLECRQLVERKKDGTCPEGHQADNIMGSVTLPADRDRKKPLPQLSSFNWAAFFMPMVWGPVHGLWAGLLMFPLWMFVDSVLFSAYEYGGWLWGGAAAVLAVTVLFMWWFGRTSNIPAYLKLKNPVTIEQYNKNQRTWTIVAVIFFAIVMVLATTYNITVRLPGLAG